jgi:hypothetical protein
MVWPSRDTGLKPGANEKKLPQTILKTRSKEMRGEIVFAAHYLLNLKLCELKWRSGSPAESRTPWRIKAHTVCGNSFAARC